MSAPANPWRHYQAPSAEAVAVVSEAIGEGGKRGMKLARILPALILRGAELGELVEYDVIAAGVQVVGRGMPASWIERLASAITTGAIDKFTAKEAVDILLQPK